MATTISLFNHKGGVSKTTTTFNLGWALADAGYKVLLVDLGKLFKSTLNNRLHRNLACVIDKSSRGAKLERAFEELP